MLISKMSETHTVDMDRVEKDFQDHITQLYDNERRLQSIITELENEKVILQKQKDQEACLRRKIEDESKHDNQKHEEEV